MNIIGLDFKNLPPCKSVLKKKIIRANYLAYMMKRATYSLIDSPSEGWSTDENGRMTIDYFDGDPFPNNITDIVLETDDDDVENEDDSTSSDDETEDDD